jgi:hypothetical protein
MFPKKLVTKPLSPIGGPTGNTVAFKQTRSMSQEDQANQNITDTRP